MAAIDEERFNMQIRKFLKNVGVTSQREIEKAIRDAVEDGRLESDPVQTRVILEIPDLGLTHTIDQDIAIR